MIEDLVEAIKNRHAILFAGAGISMSVGLPSWLYMFNLSGAPFDLVRHIFGEQGELDVGTLPLVVGNLSWVVLGTGTIWWRYRRIEVTK